ncbi:hypothetical protein HAX54_018141, partial [Datura stramonium]|nr:hypothetical protein [Datura stramonium]
VVQTGSDGRGMESQDHLMGSRPFLSLVDVAIAGHTQFRPDRACGVGAPTQSMKLSEVKRKSNQRKKELSNSTNRRGTKNLTRQIACKQDAKTELDQFGVQSTLLLGKCIR